MQPVESPPFPFDVAAERRARLALVEAVRRHNEVETIWLNAVADCVRDLKAKGMSPEAVIITMKAFIRHASVTDAARRGQGVSKALMEQIIEWCITEYYKEP
jgi:GNAT superfamily N-acetyltransferase